MKNFYLIVYSWGTTVLYIVFLLWLATIPNLGNNNELVKVVYRLILYTLLYILIYRSLIILLKSTVSRLAAWRSKREKIEDAEFVLIIETLVVIISILASILVAIADESIQTFFLEEGQRTTEVKDILISSMAIFLTSLVVYTTPVIGEFEIAIKEWFQNGVKKLRNGK